MFAPSLMEKGESIPIFLTPQTSPWIWASQILTNQTNVFSKAGCLEHLFLEPRCHFEKAQVVTWRGLYGEIQSASLDSQLSV